MANLTANRNVDERRTKRFGYKVKAGVRLFRDGIAAVTAAGLMTKPGASGAVAVVGLVEMEADNTNGADGDIIIQPKRGVFQLDVPSATHAHLGAAVYAVDDNLLSLNATDGGSPAVNYLKVGTLAGIENGKTWVEV